LLHNSRVSPIQHIVEAGAAGAAPAAGEEQAIAPRAAPPDKHMTVFIGGAPTQITQHLCSARELVDLWKINTAEIPGYDELAIIEKVAAGPVDLQGKWNVYTVMAAFVKKYKKRDAANKILARIDPAEYPSRTDVINISVESSNA
jgi:hypothetical protein